MFIVGVFLVMLVFFLLVEMFIMMLYFWKV